MKETKAALRLYIESVINDNSLQNYFESVLDSFFLLKLSKNEFLVEEGKVCPYFCFVQSGILQHAINIGGEERTTYLALKNSVTTALNSFKNKLPSRKYVRALCDTYIWALDFDTFHQLLETNEGFYRFYFNLIENQIFRIDDYRIDLLTLSPEERYKKLLINEPTLLREVPLHYLASFLGISSRNMSRIRRNIK
ncbi:MAG: Crp/Fnr family transcriptional regulator [Bacteroidota bacterium]